MQAPTTKYRTWKERILTIELFTFISYLVINNINMFMYVLAGSITTIERQFHFDSTTMGRVLLGLDLGPLGGLLFFSYFANRFNVAHVTGIMGIVFSIAITLFTLPEYIFRHENNNTESVGIVHAMLCINTTVENNMTSQDATGSNAQHVNSTAFGIMFAALFLAGVASYIAFTLPHSYIEWNTRKSRTAIYIAIANLGWATAPLFGLLLSAWSMSMYVDLSETQLTPDDPTWVGAWWLAIVIVAVLLIVTSLFYFFFPKSMEGQATNGISLNNAADAEIPSNQTLNDQKTESPVVAENTDNQKTESPEVVENTDNQKTESPVVAENTDNQKTESLVVAENTDNQKTESPEVVENTDNPVAENIDNQKTESTEVVENTDNNGKQDAHSFQGFLFSIRRLILNPVYVLSVCGYVLWAQFIWAFQTFSPKIIQEVYSMAAWEASIVAAIIIGIGATIGQVSAGVLSSCLKISLQKTLMLSIALTGMASLLMLGGAVFVGCDSPDVVGTHAYGSGFIINQNCASRCDCSAVPYSPICDAGRTYFSPCHAGCLDTNTTAMNQNVYTECSCTETGTGIRGVCEVQCNKLIPYGVIVFLVFLLTFFTLPLIIVFVMRCVEPEDMSLGFGLNMFCVGMLGFLPAPILSGSVVDTACIVWEDQGGGVQGSCWIYDLVALRQRFHGLGAGQRFLQFLCFAIAYILARNKFEI